MTSDGRAGELVRLLYGAYQRRDWAAAAALLDPAAEVDMPATAERLVGREAILAFQSGYPEPWGELTVTAVVPGETTAAAEVLVVDPAGQRYGMAAIWQASRGVLLRGAEYWVTVGGDHPPASRDASPSTRAARAAWQQRAGESGPRT